MTNKNGTTRQIKGASKINQEQHHDRVGASREMDGSFGHPFEVKTADFPVEDYTVVRVATTTAGFIWIGLEKDMPGGALNASNSMQVLANTVEKFHVGFSEDEKQSLKVKVQNLSNVTISGEESAT